MNRRIFRAICLLLAVCLLGGCAKSAQAPGPTAAPTAVPASAAPTTAPTTAPSTPEPTPVPTASPAPQETDADPAKKNFSQREFFSGDEHADVDYRDMHWELYDMTDFYARSEQLAGSDTASEAEEHYNWLLGEYVRLRTYSELAWIEFYASGSTDPALSDACQQIDDMVVEAGDVLYSSASKALAGNASGEFSEYLGDELAREMADYEDMTDRETELISRETELTLQYNELTEKKGISESSMNRQAGEIYLELIGIRNELAKINGYDTYAQYAYENIYDRDYTPEEAAALCEAIKPYARAYFRDSYYSSAFQARQTVFSAEELMGLLRTYAPQISPRAAEAQQYMEQHGLFILDDADKVSGLGFTTVLPWYNAPFLFSALYGGFYDLTSAFHEFGHYYDAYINPEPDPLSNAGSYDVFEIHSTALEALAMGWYDEIFGGEADLARIHTLDGLIYNVISGCLYDEFQQYVYAHPDLTVEGINKAYADIARSYGAEMYSSAARYGWMNVNHNFESPYYYISYAVSTLASLQFLTLSEQDRGAAIELYNTLVEIGAYDKPYEDILKETGLKLFTEDLDGIVAQPIDELANLCFRYEHKGKVKAA